MATAQDGVVSHPQLSDLGLSDRAITQRLEMRRLHEVYRGVYAVGHRRMTTRGKWIAAVLACGPGAALSRRSAAARRDWPIRERGAIDVLVPDRSYRQHAGIRIHRPIALGDADIEDVGGIPTTSVARTIVDLAGVVTRRELERALEQADHQHVLDVAAIGEVLSRIARPRGVRTLRALLKASLPQTVTRAEHEEAFLRLAARYDLPPFIMNQPVALGGGRYAVIDVLFPIQRVALELDTYATHGTPLAFARDRRRDAELSALGYHPMRLTYADTTNEGARSMQLLLAVLERADHELGGDRAGRAAG